jgi:nucleoside-diphosphate-sugar epimerase
MNATLTGSTGFIGSHILTELQEHGHQVTALVRRDAEERAWPPPAQRPPWSTSTTGRRSRRCSARRTQPSIPQALGTQTSADLDSAVVDAAIDALVGSKAAGCSA